MLLAVLQPTAANHQAPRQGPEREFMYEMVGGGMEEQGGVVTLFPLNSDFPSTNPWSSYHACPSSTPGDVLIFWGEPKRQHTLPLSPSHTHTLSPHFPFIAHTPLVCAKCKNSTVNHTLAPGGPWRQ